MAGGLHVGIHGCADLGVTGALGCVLCTSERAAELRTAVLNDLDASTLAAVFLPFVAMALLVGLAQHALRPPEVRKP